MGKTFTASYTHLKPDPRFNSELVSKFINCLMWDGKKATATRVFYDAMDLIKQRVPDVDPLQVFTAAVENVKPSVEVRSRRVGGANYQVPMQVKAKRQESLAIRWILQNARSRPEKSMPEKLANELNDAANMRGGAIKKKDDVHRMAEANKAFAHYRW